MTYDGRGDEVWKSVVGFDGYEVSDQGRVRSLPRTVKYCRSNGIEVASHHKGRILKMPPETNGYPQVYLPKTGNRCVHLLVLAAFVGPRPEGKEALHEDGDHSNAKLSNLSWGTHSANMIDRQRHGTAGRKLKVSEAAHIRKSSKSATELAAEFCVDRRTINRIKNGSIWRGA